MPYQTLLSGLYPPSPKLGLIEGFFKEGSSALKKPNAPHFRISIPSVWCKTAILLCWTLQLDAIWN